MFCIQLYDVETVKDLEGAGLWDNHYHYDIFKKAVKTKAKNIYKHMVSSKSVDNKQIRHSYDEATGVDKIEYACILDEYYDNHVHKTESVSVSTPVPEPETEIHKVSIPVSTPVPEPETEIHKVSTPVPNSELSSVCVYTDKLKMVLTCNKLGMADIINYVSSKMGDGKYVKMEISTDK